MQHVKPRYKVVGWAGRDYNLFLYYRVAFSDWLPLGLGIRLVFSIRVRFRVWIRVSVLERLSTIVDTIYYCAVWLRYWGWCRQLTKLAKRLSNDSFYLEELLGRTADPWGFGWGQAVASVVPCPCRRLLAVCMDMAASDTDGLGRYFCCCSIFCRAEILPFQQMDGT